MADDILYTPEELSKKLKLSKYTVYEMIKRGDIQAHHIGRSIRVSQTQLDLYISGARKAENVFDAEIKNDGDMQIAAIDGTDVKIFVVTDLSGKVKVSIPPEDIIISSGIFKSSARNVIKGHVSDIIQNEKRVTVILDIGIPLSILITPQSLADLEIKCGGEFYAVFKTMSVKVIA